MSKILELKFPKEDRVRGQTAAPINDRIDAETNGRVLAYKNNPEGLSRRIAELDQEWDIERFLTMNAAGLALSGVVLGVLNSKKWLVLPMTVLGFLMQHALQGWCPPLVPLRRLGIRTRQEIDREKFALKALRGDFDGDLQDPAAAIAAVDH